MLKAFSETINVADSIPVASGPIDFEDKVQQVIVRMKELGYEPTIMQVRDFVRGIGQYGDLTEFIRQLTQEEEVTNAPFSEKINSEMTLTMGSKQWQKLREEIKKWKKTGGVLKAKLKGKKGKETKKRIKELVAERGAKLTSEEMDEIATMPGVVPPWWGKSNGYYAGAKKAINKLGVSALDVHIAVERDYTDKPLNKIQKKILKVGWPDA